MSEEIKFDIPVEVQASVPQKRNDIIDYTFGLKISLYPDNQIFISTYPMSQNARPKSGGKKGKQTKPRKEEQTDIKWLDE